MDEFVDSEVVDELTIDDVIDHIFIFPSFSEIIKLAALSFYYDINELPCCAG